MALSSTFFYFQILVIFFAIYPSIFTIVESSFLCTSSPSTTCNSLIDYFSPNTTTISAITTLFSVSSLHSILGANNLPLSTPENYSIPTNQTLKIPFPCVCRNGTGISNGLPIYTVVGGDGLYHIAAEVFSGLVMYQEIQRVNNISNPELILVGQRLQIPLPCSCDEVEGQRVVHYGHAVAAGRTVEDIAGQFNTSQETLLRLNNLTSPKDLMAGTILDVPLRACSSMVDDNSLDYPLLVPNDTYVFTASDCVKCKCDATLNWMLQCESSSAIKVSCPLVRCAGAENWYLGNTTSVGCNRTTCAYAGYDQGMALTTVISESTCPASGTDHNSSATGMRSWRWNQLLVFTHLLLFLGISFT